MSCLSLAHSQIGVGGFIWGIQLASYSSISWSIDTDVFDEQWLVSEWAHPTLSTSHYWAHLISLTGWPRAHPMSLTDNDSYLSGPTGPFNWYWLVSEWAHPTLSTSYHRAHCISSIGRPRAHLMPTIDNDSQLSGPTQLSPHPIIGPIQPPRQADHGPNQCPWQTMTHTWVAHPNLLISYHRPSWHHHPSLSLGPSVYFSLLSLSGPPSHLTHTPTWACCRATQRHWLYCTQAGRWHWAKVTTVCVGSIGYVVWSYAWVSFPDTHTAQFGVEMDKFEDGRHFISKHTWYTIETPRHHSPRPYPHGGYAGHCLVTCQWHPCCFCLWRWYFFPLESQWQPLWWLDLGRLGALWLRAHHKGWSESKESWAGSLASDCCQCSHNCIQRASCKTLGSCWSIMFPLHPDWPWWYHTVPCI